MDAINMKVICAYPANIDAVCTVSGETLSPLIPSDRDFRIELKTSIASREDLLSSLLYCMRHGSGAEALIEDRALARQIEEDSAFSWRLRLGGNAAIMANVLASRGAEPVLNAPALGPRLAGLLHPRIRLPRNGVLMNPAQAADCGQQAHDEMVHYVFQFQENERIAVGDEDIKFVTPQANRFIATYDPINSRMLTDRHFDSYCLDNIKSISGALVSGFHLASHDQRQEIFSRSAAQIKSWKKDNPRLFIHVEMGSFPAACVMSSLLDHLRKIPIDSLGLNEDELALALHGESSELRDDAAPEKWQQFQLLREAEGLRRRQGLFRVAVHTRDCILSVMKAGRITPSQELAALQCGTNAAASLAATGSAAGNPGASAVVNSAGLQAKEMLCRLDGARAEGRGAFLISGDLIISLMPSLLVRKPSFTVGLGDTATAAIFLRELEAII